MRSTGIRGPSSRSSSAYSPSSASRTAVIASRPRGSTRPATRTQDPAATSSRGAASSVPVRSASTSRRASLARTSSTWSISCPGLSSRTRTRTNPRHGAGRTIVRFMPDRTALVTGGAGGLGRSVVATLVADGWDVVVPVEAGSDLEARDGREHRRRRPHRSRRRRPRRPGRGRAACARWSTSSAGSRPTSRWRTRRWPTSSGMFALNLRPTYLVTQAALPRLQGRRLDRLRRLRDGAGPVRGRRGLRGLQGGGDRVRRRPSRGGSPTACAATRSSRRMIDTPANREAMPESEWHKLVPPAKIASVIAFLCSDASAALNGARGARLSRRRRGSPAWPARSCRAGWRPS